MTVPDPGTTRLRPLGRMLRMLVGVWLVVEAARGLSEASASQRLLAAAVVLGSVAFYGAVQLVIGRFDRVNPWLGAALAMVPLAVVFMSGGPGGQLGVILFLGISLLVSAARSDPGCEVTAVPGALLGRRTHLVCLVFSPIDRLESRLAGRRASSANARTGDAS